MAVNTNLYGLSQTASTNGPDGAADPPSSLDNAIQNALAFTAMLRDGAHQYIGSIAGTNTITGSLSPAPSAYVTGQVYRFIVANTNTGAVTLNVNSVGAVAVTKNDGTALGVGFLQTGSIVEVLYTGSAFVVISASGPAPVFSAYLSGTQSVNSSTTPTLISLDAEEFDTNSTFNTGTYRHVPNIAGYYQYTGRVHFVSAASGLCGAALWKNGASFKLGQYVPLNSGSSMGCVAAALIYMNGTTDYVDLRGFQTSGGAINVGASNAFNTYLQGVLVRPG